MRCSIAIPIVVLLLILAGCQPAGRYSAPSSPATTIQTPTVVEPVDPILAWLPDTGNVALPGPPLLFVAEDTDPEGWRNFPDRGLIERPTAFLFGWPALKVPGQVAVKVPRGLPDPTPLVPAANPLTLGKWRLGRQLFHDSSWLTAAGTTSCATCHKPDRAFTDGVVHDGVRTPTLVNVVYNTRQFCDGRAVYLEEVVQQSLDDERLPDNPRPFRHAWGGVVTRLNGPQWRPRFEKVFGTPATQDAVGKAMATYLRTLLAADSVQDRAEAARRARGAAKLTIDDYQTAVDDAFLTSMGEKAEARTAVAKRLLQGQQLFQTWCVRCHGGPMYTDHGFHNLGVTLPDAKKGTGLGRLGTLPIGLKQQESLGAYATPTLRGLPRTWPYMHTGEMITLPEVVRFHARGGRFNRYLDDEYKARHASDRLGELLSAEEQSDVVLFLRALDGTTVHRHRAGRLDRQPVLQLS